MNNKLGTICLLLLSTFVDAQKSGLKLFDDSYLHEIRFESVDTNIFITTSNYQQLRMRVDGFELDSIGFIKKGNISKYTKPNKYPIKVKTNKFVKSKSYDGIKEFTLHLNYQDPTMLREKLTYDLCIDMGLYSLRTAFAKVYINNDYWGLYTIVEGKDEMYKQVFNNRDLDAIESYDLGDMCFISQNPASYDFTRNGGLPTYNLDNGEAATAWPRFARMIDKANNTSNGQYQDTVSKYLNIQDFIKYQALNVYLMNMDSYLEYNGNQIYAYDTIDHIWQIIPWDFNASFGLWNTNNFTPSSYRFIPDAISMGCIAKKIIQIPQLKTYYLDAMCELYNILSDTATYFNKIEYWKKQIQDAVYNDTRKHITNTDFENGLNYGSYRLFDDNQPALKSFIHLRNNVIKQGLINEKYSCQNLGINNGHSAIPFKIFPNPANKYLNLGLNIEEISKANVLIFNSLGQLVLSKNINTSTNINIEGIDSGLFYTIIQDQKGIKYYAKFIKE